MKIPSTLLKIVFSLLLFFNISLLWLVNKERKESSKLKLLLQASDDSIMNLKNRYDNIFLNFSLMFDIQSERINENFVFSDENDNRISIKQLAANKPRLIFKYSALNCNVCVDEQITLLKKASQEIGSENIIIITDYNSPRELTQFIRMNQIDFKVLNMRNMEFTPVDKSLPYFFILDESFSLKLLFIPIKGDTSLTQQYFEKVSKRFFNR